MTNSQKIQNRHILSLMGINLWVQRGTKTADIGAIPSRFDVKKTIKEDQLHSDLNNQPKRSDVKQSILDEKAAVHSSVTDTHLQANLMVTAKTNDQVLAAKNNTKNDDKADHFCNNKTDFDQHTSETGIINAQTIHKNLLSLSGDEFKFDLEGVRIANHIIIVEKRFLSDTEYQVWDSLKTNLGKTTAMIQRTANFPLSDDKVSECTGTFQGFLFGLKMALEIPNLALQSKDNSKQDSLVFLTPIPKIIACMQGLECMQELTLIQDFSLQKMWQPDEQAKQHKKDFWKFITRNLPTKE